MIAVPSRVAAGTPTGGQFASATRPDGDLALGATYTATAADGTRIELDPSSWSWSAEELFMQGQCLAFAAAIAREEGLSIRAAMNRSGDVLVHAWADDGGTIVDAAHGDWFDGWDEDGLRDELYAGWGDVDIIDIPVDRVEVWYAEQAAGTNAHAQEWDAARAMLPAWRAERGR